MKITVINPPGYTVEALSQKFIWALYGKTPAEFVAMFEKEIQERGDLVVKLLVPD